MELKHENDAWRLIAHQIENLDHAYHKHPLLLRINNPKKAHQALTEIERNLSPIKSQNGQGCSVNILLPFEKHAAVFNLGAQFMITPEIIATLNDFDAITAEHTFAETL